jgi:PAS domain S-box-containing protein
VKIPRRPRVSVVDEAFAAALQRTGDGAFVTADDGRVVFWNRAAERILGIPARDALTKTCCELFGGYDGAGNRLCYPGCHIRTLVRREEPVASYDMRTRTRAGKSVWLNISIVPVPSHAAGPPPTLHLFRDVTAARELLTLVHDRVAARGDGDDAGADAGVTDLTRREMEILRLLTQGLGTAAIAERLHVSRATVRNHVQSVFTKLGVHSRVAAVAYARTHRIV